MTLMLILWVVLVSIVPYAFWRGYHRTGRKVFDGYANLVRQPAYSGSGDYAQCWIDDVPGLPSLSVPVKKSRLLSQNDATPCRVGIVVVKKPFGQPHVTNITWPNQGGVDFPPDRRGLLLGLFYLLASAATMYGAAKFVHQGWLGHAWLYAAAMFTILGAAVIARYPFEPSDGSLVRTKRAKDLGTANLPTFPVKPYVSRRLYKRFPGFTLDPFMSLPMAICLFGVAVLFWQLNVVIVVGWVAAVGAGACLGVMRRPTC